MALQRKFERSAKNIFGIQLRFIIMLRAGCSVLFLYNVARRLQLIVLTPTLVLHLLDKRSHFVENILIYAVAEASLYDGETSQQAVREA